MSNSMVPPSVAPADSKEGSIVNDSMREKTGERQTNTSKTRRGTSPVRRDSQMSATQSNVGKAKRRVPSNIVTTTRSRKSSREPSPTRSATTPKTPQTHSQQSSVNHSASQSDLKQPRPQRPPLNTSARLSFSSTPPSAPTPPSLNQPRHTGSLSRKKEEVSAPPIALPLPREGSDQPEDIDTIGMRTPRSNSSTALETVEESSLPTTPAIESGKTLEDSISTSVQRQSGHSTNVQDTIPEDVSTDSASTVTRKDRSASIVSSAAQSTAESESESGYRSEDRTPTYSVQRAPPPPKSFARRPTVTGKDISSKAMTVETETVSSVPQVGLSAVGPPGGASIRSKKSTDTIRAPRKEKKRVTKKPVAGGPSNPSSKVDIFAAKIAEAVDEVNSSDSEETFVYESNPPESSHQHQRPTSRFHSRTPSATSIGPDLRGQRLPLSSAVDGTNSTGRKGMKFVNNSLNKDPSLGGDGIPSDRSGELRTVGSSRAPHNGNGRGGMRHHNGQRSILDEDHVFHRPMSHSKPSTQSLRHAASIQSSRQSSRPTSPKQNPMRNGGNLMGIVRKSPRTRVYEADAENGDDEHTPLLSTTRTRVKRKNNGSLRPVENHLRRRGWVRKYAGCIVAMFAIILILVGVGGFLVSTTNALQGVRVINVTDVLVSKQEIMLDLVVEAVNPNAIAVTIGSMDVNLFAKSSFVRDEDDGEDVHKRERDRKRLKATMMPGAELSFGIDSPKRIYPPPPAALKQHSRGHGIDEGTDPPDDLPETDKETMLLGRIFSFDSVLTFDGSPIRRIPSVSIGELRLAKPGNKTEEGGTERWERVLLHPFELIIRGVLKYQLPLSGRIRTAPISGSAMIHPELDSTK